MQRQQSMFKTRRPGRVSKAVSGGRKKSKRRVLGDASVSAGGCGGPRGWNVSQFLIGKRRRETFQLHILPGGSRHVAKA